MRMMTLEGLRHKRYVVYDDKGKVVIITRQKNVARYFFQTGDKPQLLLFHLPHLVTLQPVLNNLNSQTLFTQVITYIFSIKGFLARGTYFRGGHWLVVQHQSEEHNTTILRDGKTLCFAWKAKKK